MEVNRRDYVDQSGHSETADPVVHSIIVAWDAVLRENNVIATVLSNLRDNQHGLETLQGDRAFKKY